MLTVREATSEFILTARDDLLRAHNFVYGMARADGPPVIFIEDYSEFTSIMSTFQTTAIKERNYNSATSFIAFLMGEGYSFYALRLDPCHSWRCYARWYHIRPCRHTVYVSVDASDPFMLLAERVRV